MKYLTFLSDFTGSFINSKNKIIKNGLKNNNNNYLNAKKILNS